MSRQVLRSKPISGYRRIKYDKLNINVENMEINNETTDNVIFSNSLNNINVVSKEKVYTKLDNIRIGKNITEHIYDNYTVAIGINSGYSNQAEGSFIIGNNSFSSNFSKNSLCIGNNNLSNELSLKDNLYIIGNDNYATGGVNGQFKTKFNIIGLNNIIQRNIATVGDLTVNDHAMTLCGSINTFTGFTGETSCIGNYNSVIESRTDGINASSESFLAGSSNMLTSLYHSTFMGFENILRTYYPNNTNADNTNIMIGSKNFRGVNFDFYKLVKNNGFLCIGNSNGISTKIPTQSDMDAYPDSQAVVCIGNNNNNEFGFYYRETIIGNFNNNKYEAVRTDRARSTTIGNNNNVVADCITIGNGVTVSTPNNITINTFSSSVVIPPQNSVSNFRIICPFGSNVSTNAPNGKLFYDAIKKKLVYNIK
jgi:hypothetical protein